MEVRLDDKVALITGATQGIGEAIAELAARSGVAGLLLTGRNAAKGRKVAERISKIGTRAEFLAADLGDERAPARLVKRCLKNSVASTRW